MFTVKRIYDPPAADDGYRVLVDRLWPRGISKARADIDLWLKEVAPSTELRRWFHEDPAGEGEVFDRFRARYEQELETNPALDELRDLGRSHPRVTLLVGARDPELNHGKVLEEYLEHLSVGLRRFSRRAPAARRRRRPSRPRPPGSARTPGW